ncbi:unnamed protein product, partial [Oikopleura dioica]
MEREQSWFNKKTRVKLEVPAEDETDSSEVEKSSVLPHQENTELVEKLMDRVSTLENLFKAQEKSFIEKSHSHISKIEELEAKLEKRKSTEVTNKQNSTQTEGFSLKDEIIRQVTNLSLFSQRTTLTAGLRRPISTFDREMSVVLKKFKMASLEDMVLRMEDMEDSLADLRTKSIARIETPVQTQKKSRSFNFEQIMKKMPFQECSNSRKCDELEYLLDSQICKLSDRLQYIENSINRTKSRLSAEKSLKKLELDFALTSGEALGLSTGVIADDQIEVSDSTAPELKAPRLGFSNWNSISGNSWVKISFRRPTVVKSIAFLSPQTQVGSLMMVTSAKIAYLSLKGNWRKLEKQVFANSRTDILESTHLDQPIECSA